VPIVNGYATLAEVKTRLGIADTNDDSVLEQLVMAASRMIDEECHRQFYADSQTLVFTAPSPTWLPLPDLISVTTLKTDEDGDRTYEVTWASTDYDLDPANAQYDAIPQPFDAVSVAPNGRYTFPLHARGVQIVGSWGFAAAAPDAIREACLLGTIRLFRRKEVPFGVLGAADMTSVRLFAELDPDARKLIAPFRRRVVA
jgi:hypothetical protein